MSNGPHIPIAQIGGPCYHGYRFSVDLFGEDMVIICGNPEAVKQMIEFMGGRCFGPFPGGVAGHSMPFTYPSTTEARSKRATLLDP